MPQTMLIMKYYVYGIYDLILVFHPIQQMLEGLNRIERLNQTFLGISKD